MSEELKSKFEEIFKEQYFGKERDVYDCMQAAYDMAKADEWVSVEVINERISELKDMQKQASFDHEFCLQIEYGKNELEKLLTPPNQ